MIGQLPALQSPGERTGGIGHVGAESARANAGREVLSQSVVVFADLMQGRLNGLSNA